MVVLPGATPNLATEFLMRGYLLIGKGLNRRAIRLRSVGVSPAWRPGWPRSQARTPLPCTRTMVCTQILRPVSRARASQLPAGSARRGTARMPCIGRGQWIALLPIPVGSEKRRISATVGCPFFWFLFLGLAKEKEPALGCGNPIQKTVASATLLQKLRRIIQGSVMYIP